MSAPGEVSRLSRRFEPDVAAITLIALEHLEFLGSLDAIAKANARDSRGAGTDGTSSSSTPTIPAIAAIAAGHSGRMLRFGTDAAGRRAGRAGRHGGPRLALPPEGARRARSSSRCRCRAAHQVANFLAASAVAIAAGASVENCAEAAPKLVPASHRGEIAPPCLRRAALRRRLQREPALDARGARHAEAPAGQAEDRGARRHARARPRVGVVAPRDGALRRAAAPTVSSAWDRSAGISPKARSRPGFRAARCECSTRPEHAANLLDSMLDAGDTVLFKASRGVGLERAVDAARGGSERRRSMSARGGLMLYYWLYPARPAVSGLQRLPLHHVPHGDGGADGARAAAPPRAVA